MTTAVYTLSIDWTGAGDWTLETANLLSATVERGFDSPLARMASTGRATFVLSNRDRAYSPALAANVLPRRQVWFLMMVSFTNVTLFRGFIESIRPTAGAWAERTVTLDCVDATALFDLHEGEMALLQYARADDIIDAVVDAVYTPPGTSYQRGVNVFPVSGDKWSISATLGAQSETVRASQKIQDAAASDWGRFFVGKSGWPVYRHRYYGLNVEPTFTVSDTGAGDGLEYQRSVSDVFNLVEIAMTPRSVGAVLEVLGRSERVIKLDIGASQTVTLSFKDAATGNPIGGLDVLTPEADTDYTATSDEAGEGDDLTASVAVTVTAYSDKADVTVTNNAAQAAWVRDLQVRGYAVRGRAAVTMSASDAASITAYQKRKLSLTMPLTGSDYEAQRLADYLLAGYKDPSGVVRGVRVFANADATTLAWARDVELLDTVGLTETQTGLVEYAGQIFRLRHEIRALTEHIVTVDLQPAARLGYAPADAAYNYLLGYINSSVLPAEKGYSAWILTERGIGAPDGLTVSSAGTALDNADEWITYSFGTEGVQTRTGDWALYDAGGFHVRLYALADGEWVLLFEQDPDTYETWAELTGTTAGIVDKTITQFKFVAEAGHGVLYFDAAGISTPVLLQPVRLDVSTLDSGDILIY